jgi:hypothetical protein
MAVYLFLQMARIFQKKIQVSNFIEWRTHTTPHKIGWYCRENVPLPSSDILVGLKY